jgi:uncharacterized protein (TIRG00374 family)
MTSAQITARTKNPMKRLILIAAKLAITGALAWYLFGEIDLRKSGAHLANFDIGWGILALLVLALLFFIAAFRWQIYARALGIPLAIGTAFRLYLIGQFFGQILPAGIGGDALRVWLLARRGVALGTSAASVVLERLTGLLGLLVLMALLLPLTFTFVDDTAARLTIIILLVGGVGAISAVFGLSFVPRLIKQWRVPAVISKMADAASDARRSGLMLKPAASVFFLSLLMQLLAVLSVFLLALGLGMDLPALACLALVPVVLLVSTLPISLAGWGVREGAMVATLGFAGIENSQALALSILFGLALLALSLLGAIFWLVQGRRKSPIATAEKSGAEAALQ